GVRTIRRIRVFRAGPEDVAMGIAGKRRQLELWGAGVRIRSGNGGLEHGFLAELEQAADCRREVLGGSDKPRCAGRSQRRPDGVLLLSCAALRCGAPFCSSSGGACMEATVARTSCSMALAESAPSASPRARRDTRSGVTSE